MTCLRLLMPGFPGAALPRRVPRAGTVDIPAAPSGRRGMDLSETQSTDGGALRPKEA